LICKTAFGLHMNIRILGGGITLFLFLIGLTTPVALGQKPDPELETFLTRFPTPLLRAIALNDIPWLESEIKKGAAIDPVPGTKIDNSPLFLAISFRHFRILNILLENKANVNITGPLGETPLMLALFYKDSKDYIRTLLEAGADINAKSSGGTSVLMTAAEYADVEVLDMLLNKKPDVNHINEKGITALMVASNNADVVKRLLKAGAQLENKDVYGETAVFHAIREHRLEKLKTLIQAGARKEIANQDGLTPEALVKQISDASLREQMLAILDRSDRN